MPPNQSASIRSSEHPDVPPPLESSRLLKSLWQSRAQSLAANVANGSREHREVAHAADLISHDYHGRFLVELLQNANDQAIRGKLSDSTVVIVRTEGLLAVSNQGQGMSFGNLQRVSSLADSDKSGELVGNKGVGFKAVYQVTDAPEIYSLEHDNRDKRGPSSWSLELGCALELNPFGDAGLKEAVVSYIRRYLEENHGLREALQKQAAGSDPIDSVLSELGHVAGFKFPLQRTARDLEARLSELAIPEELVPFLQTLVVLPLRDDDARRDATKVVDLLIGNNGREGQAELAVLFLNGVKRIVVLDHSSVSKVCFERSATIPTDRVEEIEVRVERSPSDIRTTTYRCLRRNAFAGPAALAAKRQELVQKALSEFKLEAWSVSDTLLVTLALAIPDPADLGRHGADGKFCLGLPTMDGTGLPVHVDARFFATISRTGLEFGHTYNAFLLDVAVETFGILLDHLRGSRSKEVRREATLALRRDPGPMAERVYAPGGLADGDVVLLWGGSAFAKRVDCKVLVAKERKLLHFLAEEISASDGFAQGLPEEKLLVDCSDVLESLGLQGQPKEKHPWLAQAVDRKSLVECTAVSKRAAGLEFWGGFVEALLECFGKQELNDLEWLPVGETDLVAPSAHVFLPPRGAGEEDDVVEQLPPEVAGRLRLIDSRALPFDAEFEQLKELRGELLDKSIVYRSSPLSLLRYSIFPILQRTEGDTSDHALNILRLAIQWIAEMSSKQRTSLDAQGVMVPARMKSGEIRWQRASETYLGEGWSLDEEAERLLACAYDGARLIDLSELISHGPFPAGYERSCREAAELLGVHSLPRIVDYTNSNAPLVSSQAGLEVVGTPALGVDSLEDYYRNYLDALASVGSGFSHRYPHNVDRLLWLDGLECDEKREAVVDLILSAPLHFKDATTVRLGRMEDFDRSKWVYSFWAWCLRNHGWAVFPAEKGVAREPVRVMITDLWRIPDQDRRTGYASLLATIPKRLDEAAPFLLKLGASNLGEATFYRLYQTLDTLAERLAAERIEREGSAFSLASELFAKLATRGEADSSLKLHEDIRLPLQRGDSLVPVSPGKEPMTIFLNDDPIRGRWVAGLAEGWQVPLGDEKLLKSLHALLSRSLTECQIILTSSAKIDLGFESEGQDELFLEWLERCFPGTHVAKEIAALLTFKGDFGIQAGTLATSWERFSRLSVVSGRFRRQEMSCFYDRGGNLFHFREELPAYRVIAELWQVGGLSERDLFTAYAAALEKQETRRFLLERGIGEVQLVGVADAAGLHRAAGVGELAPTLVALWRYRHTDATWDQAYHWLNSASQQLDEIAAELGDPGLATVLRDAVSQGFPRGSLSLLKYAQVPAGLWQEALEFRGERYVFPESVRQFRMVRRHLIAVARDLAHRDRAIDLDALGEILERLVTQDPPDEVRFHPREEAGADEAALRSVSSELARFGPISSGLRRLPALPWADLLPVPQSASQRGVKLFRDVEIRQREIDSSTTVRAVVEVAQRIAEIKGLDADLDSALADERLQRLMKGEWAHVYAALATLRNLITEISPELADAVTELGAFREQLSRGALFAKLPGAPTTAPALQEPKQPILGHSMTAGEAGADMIQGSSGAIGTALKEAALEALVSGIPQGVRGKLEEAPGGGRPGGTGGGPGRGFGSHTTHESQSTGDMGEAFVHEWLALGLGEHYGPECWISRSRERYGFPDSGDDRTGHDFRVSDPEGKLFNLKSSEICIEVKASTSEGGGPFPMSRPEWEKARECHEGDGSSTYVIVRVAGATSRPRISDIVIDPFGAFRRGEVRFVEKDLWVTVAPLDPPSQDA